MGKTNLSIAMIATSFIAIAQVGINTTTPDVSAALEVESTIKGLLMPRMTESQMNAIQSPAEGLMVYCTDCTSKGLYYNDGFNFVNFATAIPANLSPTDVYSPTTGIIWMDRNLGATQVATSSTDAASYGDLYQWGRGTDGHEKRSSATTTTISTTETPAHSDFITPTAGSDWQSTSNDNLWQGVSGVNNPCPTGYRLPTETEWETERASWSSNDLEGAFASPLRLPLVGSRKYNTGVIESLGTVAVYWSSTVSGIDSRCLFFDSSSAAMYTNNRSFGRAIRCVKDY